MSAQSSGGVQDDSRMGRCELPDCSIAKEDEKGPRAMRYLIDPEFRQPRPNSRPESGPDSSPDSHPDSRPRISSHYVADLRRELSVRNQQWARDGASSHEITLGNVPAVLYCEDELGRHGNFCEASYQQISRSPAWRRRLLKVHTSSKRALLSRDPGRRELDSSNSSDALLMNIFCHPETLATPSVHRLLGIEPGAEAVFGYKPRVPLLQGKKDCTEVDLKLGDLLVEAKLTEYDFQQAPRRMVERYPRFAEVFDIHHPDLCGPSVESYQLIRGVLAADADPGHRFCVLCDDRRPDLIARWHQLLLRVTPYDLRCRMLLLTWQELASALPAQLQQFLETKYGILHRGLDTGSRQEDWR